MLQYLQSCDKKINQLLWKKASDSTLFRMLLALYAVLNDLGNGYITMCAKSLVYTTLLSLVPLLAVSFSFLKAFGVHNQIKPLLNEALLPLGEKGMEISDSIVGFIDNVNVGVLGAVGIIVLLFTVVSVISTVESTLNSIWHISKPRSVIQRVSYYLSVIIVAPVLAFTGIGLTASLLDADLVKTILSVEPLGSFYYLLVFLAPYFLLTIAFSLIYIFLPNTKVESKAAFIGALVAVVLWRIAGEIFAMFVSDFSNYDAIYSGFATLILFLIWLFVSWLIFLFGGKLAFYFQHPEYISSNEVEKGNASDYRIRLLLTVMFLIATQHVEDKTRWSLASLTKCLRVPVDDLREVLDSLVSCGILVFVDDKVSSVVLAKEMGNIETYRLFEISKTLTKLKGGTIGYSSLPVDKLLSEVDNYVASALKGNTVKNWITLNKVHEK